MHFKGHATGGAAASELAAGIHGDIDAQVAAILADVRTRRDAAVADYTRRFDRREPTAEAPVVVAVPVLPRISNFDDLDPLRAEPGVTVDFIPPGRALPGDADLVVLPGSIATREFRSDRSRYFPTLDAQGRITGGRFM